MRLDSEICSRARLARDPRFDGRFFIAVLTTRIYCRPICPARAPKEENIRYYATAAAAAEAGFRPCLRCRPECSPGTPAWLGTSATVSRALRLIGESALEDGSVDSLAARLGIGARHLRRLFLQHLGASPVAIAQTRRLHFAKKLIDETSLPMGQVALASGFGSVRRFNATLQKTYGRTPTHIRGLARRAPAEERHQYRFLLRFRPPFDWKGILEFLAPRATPGVEEVEGDLYRRAFLLSGEAGWLEASLEATANAVSLRIHFPDPCALFLIVERVRRLFDLAADPAEIAQHLRRDPRLAPRISLRPGLRVPGAWDGFELAVRAILGQQVTVRGATTLAGRLVREFGTPIVTNHGLTHMFPDAVPLTDADVGRIGLPRARAHTIRSLARAVADGDLSFSTTGNREEFLERFRRLPGIGDWTAHYVAMRALGEPDAFPAADLGLLKAAGLTNPRQLEALSEAWSPWRAYAAMHLWQTVTDTTANPGNQRNKIKRKNNGATRVLASSHRFPANCRKVKSEETSTMTSYTQIESPLGPLLLAGDDNGLRVIEFMKSKRAHPPDPAWREDPRPLKDAIRQLRAYFAGDLETFDLPLAPEGTPFQQNVWRRLCDIPYGETISYGELARRIGNPNASRAVGLANGSNPIPIIIPCHRVIGSNGKLTGYGGGLPIKEKLLALERRQLTLL